MTFIILHMLICILVYILFIFVLFYLNLKYCLEDINLRLQAWSHSLEVEQMRSKITKTFWNYRKINEMWGRLRTQSIFDIYLRENKT